MEALGLALHQNPEIEGIKIGNQVIKAGQFADDLWMVSPSTQQNVNNILLELDSFKKFSGLTINTEKCGD